MTAAAQATVNPLAAALGPGARGERRALILERAVFAATSSVRIDVSAMEAAVSAMKDTLVGLKTKLDSDIQLSQQTLMWLVAVEETVLDDIKSAFSLGKLSNAGAEDDNMEEKENIVNLVTVCLLLLDCARDTGQQRGGRREEMKGGGEGRTRALCECLSRIPTHSLLFRVSLFLVSL